jgi:hypothetical protein
VIVSVDSGTSSLDTITKVRGRFHASFLHFAHFHVLLRLVACVGH